MTNFCNGGNVQDALGEDFLSCFDDKIYMENNGYDRLAFSLKS